MGLRRWAPNSRANKAYMSLMASVAAKKLFAPYPVNVMAWRMKGTFPSLMCGQLSLYNIVDDLTRQAW